MEQHRNLYLDLMKLCLTDSIYGDTNPGTNPQDPAFDKSIRYRGTFNGKRNSGWPSHAHTMIKLERMNNVQKCVEDVLKKDVPGDLIETGVWRGGTTIFMRAILRAYDITDRSVWAVDSFEGLPEPHVDTFPADAGDLHYTFKKLAVSLEAVQENFSKYGLLDEQVKFLKGWFHDTLPTIPSAQQFAVIRLDGDMYGSTWDALGNLYPKLAVGGYCIIDDYGACVPCRQAVDDYRTEQEIPEEIKWVDWTGVYWQKFTSTEKTRHQKETLIEMR